VRTWRARDTFSDRMELAPPTPAKEEEDLFVGVGVGVGGGGDGRGMVGGGGNIINRLVRSTAYLLFMSMCMYYCFMNEE